MSTQEKIIHIEFHTGSHHYFGSISAIFETFSTDTIGITMKSLYNYNFEKRGPYVNKKCIIRIGLINRKPQQN